MGVRLHAARVRGRRQRGSGRAPAGQGAKRRAYQASGRRSRRQLQRFRRRGSAPVRGHAPEGLPQDPLLDWGECDTLVPDATTELEHASADIVLTRDAREILDRAAKVATARGSLHIVPADVFNATLQLPGNLADAEMRALGFDPKSIAPLIEANGAGETLPLRQLLVNANREAGVLGHYQVDSIHLLLPMLYSDSPSSSGPLMNAGLTLYDLRRHVHTGTKTGAPPVHGSARPDAALRKRPCLRSKACSASARCSSASSA